MDCQIGPDKIIVGSRLRAAADLDEWQNWMIGNA
jgi:hypothetical protein